MQLKGLALTDYLMPPHDAGSPAFTAEISESGRLEDLSSQILGLPGRLVGWGGVFRGGEELDGRQDGDLYAGQWGAIEWKGGDFHIEAAITPREPGAEFLMQLEAVERVFDDLDLTLEGPVSGRRLLSLHSWEIEFELEAFAEIGAPNHHVKLPVRRVLSLESSVDGTLSSDGIYRIPLAPEITSTIRLVVRYPLVSKPGTYATHDGGEQWWRTITIPGLPDGPKPLFVGLHGSGNAADNFIGLSHPCIAGSMKAVLPALLGGVLIAPNANDAPGPESDPAEMPRPAMYHKDQQRYVFDAIDEAARLWEVDRSRIYLMGISMGGHGALTIAAHHPDRFAFACAVVPPTDLAKAFRHLDQFPDPGRAIPEMVETFGGTPDEVPLNYQQGSVLAIAENLANTPVVFRGGVMDPLVPAREHITPLENKLNELGYKFDASMNEKGHHVDSNTIEGGHERALEWLLERPKVDASPERVVYKTADLHWPGAWWLEIEELQGEGFGMVDAFADREANKLVLKVEGVKALRIDVQAAGLSGEDLAVEMKSDDECIVTVDGATPKEVTHRLSQAQP